MNVLVALLDENHTHNSAAETWLAGNIHQGWAVRNRITASATLSVFGVYLLALAVEHGCRLVTFDTSILVAAVRRAARPSLVVI